MLQYIMQRLLYMLVTLFAVSIVSFVIIELPPGDYLTSYAAQLAASGDTVDQAQLESLEKRFGLDLPVYQRYFKWVTDMMQGDFGYSFTWNKPVSELIWERLGMTLMITITALLFTWVLGFIIGVFSAVRQYSLGDYIFTTFSFIGLGIPDFLLALVLMWVGFRYFDANVGGLFSREFQTLPWSWAKFVDMLAHLWVPLLVLSVGGTAGMIRIMRANLLDELRKPYVETARARGVSETQATPEISCADFAQPVHQYGRLGVARSDQWRNHHLGRTRLANSWTITPQCTAVSGYVFSFQFHFFAQCIDYHRHDHFGYIIGVA